MRRVKAMDTDLIFVGKHLNAPHDFRHGFNEACKMAGLEDVTFHTLRHTSCSRLAQAGVDILAIAEHAGHRSLSMTRRYSHLCIKGRANHDQQRFCLRGKPWIPTLHLKRACQPNVAAGRASKAIRSPYRRRRQVVFNTSTSGPEAIERATRLLEESAVYRTEAMNSPSAVRDYLRLKLAPLEHEEFHVIWLDAQNRIIAFDRLFRGALTQTAVHPREVVKAGPHTTPPP